VNIDRDVTVGHTSVAPCASYDYHVPIRRRTLLFLIASLFGTGGRADAQTEKPSELTVEIALGTDKPDAVLAILREVEATNVHQPSDRGLGGVDAVVAGVLVAKGLANLVMRLLAIWQCGVQVDARANLITTEKNCDLPRGTLLVINRDGSRSRMPQPSATQIQSLAEKFPARE